MPGAATVHANSAADALDKLAMLPLLAGRNIDRAFIAPALAMAVDLVVHCGRDLDGTRRVREVIAPTGEVVDGRIVSRTVYEHGADAARHTRTRGELRRVEVGA